MAARHSPHTMNQELLKAVCTGDADLLAQVLGIWSTAAAQDGNESCLKGITAEGSSALHIAASRGYMALVVLIYTHDTSLIMARNNQLDTPLICAARSGHVDVVDYLIERAWDQHQSGHPQQHGLEEAAVSPVLKARNSGGATAMHEAVRNGHVSILRSLMSRDGRLAAVVDGQGVSLLYLAVVSNRADMVDILIRESSDGVRSPASCEGPHGQTALHAAVYANNAREISESLLHWDPTLAEKADISGRTALHYAASDGNIGVVKLLLGNGSLAYIPDNDGLFPVHAAAIAGYSKVILEFMKMCPGCDELVDKKHRNILHCAVEHGSFKVVWHIWRNPKFVSTMINSGDSEGNTPLHLAVKHGRARIFSLLMMDMRVNLSNINHKGLTPLRVVLKEILHNYSFSLLKNSYIMLSLVFCEAYPHHPQHIYLPEKSLEEDEKELSSYTNVSQSILYISVLIATGSFAAGFDPPGGYVAEGENAGMPVFKEETYFMNCVFENSMSFYFSTVATCLLVHACLTTTTINKHLYLILSAVLVSGAVTFMIAAFTNAVSLVLDPQNGWGEWFLFYFIDVVKDVTRLTLVLPVSMVTISGSLRAAMQLRTRKHSCKGILFKLLPAGCLLTMLAILVHHFIRRLLFLIEIDLPGRQELCSGPACVYQGDAKFLYPT